jgi:hypothetical protein
MRVERQRAQWSSPSQVATRLRPLSEMSATIPSCDQLRMRSSRPSSAAHGLATKVAASGFVHAEITRS